MPPSHCDEWATSLTEEFQKEKGSLFTVSDVETTCSQVCLCSRASGKYIRSTDRDILDPKVNKVSPAKYSGDS